jgi:hypothetical protein
VGARVHAAVEKDQCSRLGSVDEALERGEEGKDVHLQSSLREGEIAFRCGDTKRHSGEEAPIDVDLWSRCTEGSMRRRVNHPKLR